MRPNNASDCPLYIASPLGFSEAGRDFYYGKFLPSIQNNGFPILDPWQLTPKDQIDKVIALPYGKEKKEEWRKLNRVIGKNNEQAIIKSKGIVAILDGVDVDSGTATEIGFGYAQRNPILGYRGDFRLSADNEGSIVNLQVEYFILESGGRVVTSLDDLTKSLREVFLEK